MQSFFSDGKVQQKFWQQSPSYQHTSVAERWQSRSSIDCPIPIPFNTSERCIPNQTISWLTTKTMFYSVGKWYSVFIAKSFIYQYYTTRRQSGQWLITTSAKILTPTALQRLTISLLIYLLDLVTDELYHVLIIDLQKSILFHMF